MWLLVILLTSTSVAVAASDTALGQSYLLEQRYDAAFAAFTRALAATPHAPAATAGLAAATAGVHSAGRGGKSSLPEELVSQPTPEFAAQPEADALYIKAHKHVVTADGSTERADPDYEAALVLFRAAVLKIPSPHFLTALGLTAQRYAPDLPACLHACMPAYTCIYD